MLGSAIEYADTLPKNWQIDQLGNLGTYINGFAFKPTDWRDNGRPIIRIQNLNDPLRPFNYFDDEIDQRYLIGPGDILISWSASLDAFLWNNGEAWLNQHIFKALPDEGRLDRGFFFYAMKYAMLRIATHARGSTMRHVTAKQFKQSELAFPPLPGQRKIAAVLSLVQRAIEQQERLIALTIELKKAMMHKLFTEGTRGEAQKQTEIGPIPESWEVVELGNVLGLAQYGLSMRADDDGAYPMLRMTNQVDGKIVPHDLKYVNLGGEDFSKFRVLPGDVLFNRTNSFDLVGRTAIYDLYGDYVFASYLIRLRINEALLNPYFLNHYFNWDETQLRLKSIASRAVSQSNISATRLKGFIVPLPVIEEQTEIIENLDLLDSMRNHYRQVKDSFRDLFRTLLHQLMTAEIQVNDLDLSDLGIETPTEQPREEAI